MEIYTGPMSALLRGPVRLSMGSLERSLVLRDMSFKDHLCVNVLAGSPCGMFWNQQSGRGLVGTLLPPPRIRGQPSPQPGLLSGGLFLNWNEAQRAVASAAVADSGPDESIIRASFPVPPQCPENTEPWLRAGGSPRQ